MTQQPSYLRYLEAAKQAETAESLQSQGYSVEVDYQLGDSLFDLVAIKGTEKLAYEFKAGRSARTARQNLVQLQKAAEAQGFKLRIVVVNPPPRVHVEVDRLRDHLLDHMVNKAFPDELNSLSTHTRIEGLSDIEISDIRVAQDEIKLSGAGSVDVELQYGSGSDADSGQGSNLFDSYPFQFKVTLGTDGELLSVDRLDVDVTSFYEE